MTDEKRRYESPKRKEQAARTRERLLDVARVFLERNDPETLSLPKIAQLAEVGASVVYANFASAEALLLEVLGALQAKMWPDGATQARGVDALQRIPLERFPVYRAHRGLLTAMVHSLAWQRHIADGRDARRAAFAAPLRAVAPALDEREREALGAVLQMLGAPRTWYFLEEASGLDPELAARAAAFTVRALVEQLRREPTGLRDLHVTTHEEEQSER